MSILVNPYFQKELHTQIFQKYELNPDSIQKLEQLNQYKIVFILDDSGSMNTIEQASNVSRWDELLHFMNISLEIALLYNTEGCDIHFLNRQSVKNCKDKTQLNSLFQDKPYGYTLLTRTVQQVIDENPVDLLQGRQLLLIITTDGVPTDAVGNTNLPEFTNCLSNRPSYVFTNIIACTNDQNSIGYLNNLDKKLPRLDVVDDYSSELSEIRKAGGQQISFSFGDYVVKSLVGSIESKTDKFDE